MSSDPYNQNKCDLSVSECSNCVLMENQLHSALDELESAKLIIQLLQKESDKDSLMVTGPAQQLIHLEI